MRILIAAAMAFFVSACSNPWGSVQVTELPAPLRYAVAKPSRLVFGNYCGFGTRTGDLSASPVDRLDAICYEHDGCYVDRRDHCECDETLVRRAREIRDDGDATPRMRRQAVLLITTFALPLCKAFPDGFLPPRPRSRSELEHRAENREPVLRRSDATTRTHGGSHDSFLVRAAAPMLSAAGPAEIAG